MGHNGGPSLYVNEIGKLQAIDAVLQNRVINATEALILIGLIIRSNPQYANAFPGAATLAVYAKVARTDQVWAALRKLEDHFAMISRKSRGSGRSNSYTVMPQRVVDAIVAEYETRKAAKAATQPLVEGAPVEQAAPLEGVSSPKPTPLEGVSLAPEATPAEGVAFETHPLRGGTTHPRKGGTYPFNDPSQNKQEGQNKFVPVNWRTALNPHAAADAQDVFWVDGCRIEVMNGFKVELERDFPNVDLIAGLSAVAGETTPDVVGTDLKRRVRRRFGYLQNDEKNRDRRHANTVKAKNPTKPFKPSRW